MAQKRSSACLLQSVSVFPCLARAPEIYNEVGYDLLSSDRKVQALEDLPKVSRGQARQGGDSGSLRCSCGMCV